MNLSDETSRDSSVMIGQEYEENILFAGHNDVDLSVSSNGEFGQNQDRGNNQDLLAENQRLLQENNALRERIAQLEGEGGGGGGEAEGGRGCKPWSQLGEEWKRIRTGSVVTEIDRLAGVHHTSGVTITASILKRRARVLKLQDIYTVAKRIEEGLPIDSHQMPILVATWLCVRTTRHFLWRKKKLMKMLTACQRYELLQEDSQPITYP